MFEFCRLQSYMLPCPSDSISSYSHQVKFKSQCQILLHKLVSVRNCMNSILNYTIKTMVSITVSLYTYTYSNYSS